MLSYLSGFSSFMFLVFLISQAGVYHKHYVDRSIRFEQARTLLHSNACTKAENRVVLSQRCNEAMKVMYEKPYIYAIYDTADDLQIPYTKNLHKFVIYGAIIALVVLWASGIQLRRNSNGN